MRKTTIYLDEPDDLLLTKEAERRGTSRTELIREAIRRMLAEDQPSRPRPRTLGHSGHRETSERVDAVLSEGFGR
jgi:metal-responsive CopG/Arc/MetJ family transcriptional regulator